MYCKEKWRTAGGKAPLLGRVYGFQIDPCITIAKNEILSMTFHEIFCAGGKYFLPRPPTLHAPNVGAATSRPVVSPWGKQRRSFAPTMQYQTFANEIRRYNVETWYILQHFYITGPIRFCSKIYHVGGRLIAAPTRAYPLKLHFRLNAFCLFLRIIAVLNLNTFIKF